RELLWLLGCLIYLVMMATAFMGYLLPWGQMSFWGATVITNLFSAIPYVGTDIAQWLWGGYTVDNATLNRFYSLHYLLPFIIAAIVGLHIWALHVPGNNNPLGIDVKGPQDTVPFHPYYTVKDGFALSAFVLLYAGLVFFAPNMLGEPVNYVPANPLSTPPHIVPEWYLLPFYAILRSIPNKLIGVLALVAAIGTLFVVPWLDTSKVRSARFRPLYRPFFWVLILVCIGLGYIGAKEVTPGRIFVGQILTAYYYVHFLVILPLLGLIETPDPLPNSISESVLGSGATAMPVGAHAAPERKG
ncbi:MAG: cytochrome b N-terminal domain-containing protein, partial [Hyphomicrobiales bacterium]|nr:cytochrome b N-terminal domain-containing protein [Hyphomicrobiales bacterium]